MTVDESLQFAIFNAGKLFLDLRAALDENYALKARIKELEDAQHAGTVVVENGDAQSS